MGIADCHLRRVDSLPDQNNILIVHQIRLSLLTSYLFNTPIEAY
jgi:hypothetical protein